jgi:hypothetical protein
LYYVVSSTDAALPLGSWATVSTNTFNADGSFVVILPVLTAEPQRYYGLSLP